MATKRRTTHGIGRFYEITILYSNLMLFTYMVRVTSADMIKNLVHIAENTNFCSNFWWISRTKENWFSAVVGTFIKRVLSWIKLTGYFLFTFDLCIKRPSDCRAICEVCYSWFVRRNQVFFTNLNHIEKLTSFNIKHEFRKRHERKKLDIYH